VFKKRGAILNDCHFCTVSLIELFGEFYLLVSLFYAVCSLR